MTSQFGDLFLNDFLACMPEIFLILSTIGLLMLCVTLEKTNHPKSALISQVNIWTLLVLILTLGLVLNNPCIDQVFFFNTLIQDSSATFFKAFLLIGCIACCAMSQDYLLKNGIFSYEYMILILFSTSSMMLMISSYDMISMYLTIEMQTLCFYVLACSKRNSEFSTEAGLKYFILGAFSSGILLFGISLIYGFSGITNFEDLRLLCSGENITQSWNDNQVGTGVIIGMLFITVGFLFKLTSAPFHMWAPDVYEGAPTPVTAFFSVGPKIAIFALFSRLFGFSGAFAANANLFQASEKILIFSSICSMIIGALFALSQQKIKRLLAYSSIGHVGYMIIGFICASPEGMESFLVYLMIYMVMTINVFAILLSLRSSTSSGHSSETVQARYLTDLSQLSKTHPLLALTFTISLFSMAGIPPLAVFCGKFYIFFSALSGSLYILACLGVLTSAISCFYYIRMIKIMYFEKLSGETVVFDQMDNSKAIIITCSMFFLVFFIFYPGPLFLIAQKLVSGL
jgi:proton-translocating NADH-quinone oxidoreductase chain N